VVREAANNFVCKNLVERAATAELAKFKRKTELTDADLVVARSAALEAERRCT